VLVGVVAAGALLLALGGPSRRGEDARAGSGGARPASAAGARADTSFAQMPQDHADRMSGDELDALAAVLPATTRRR